MEAWVTLATNDGYAVGALVLAESLRRVQTTRKLVILATNSLSAPMVQTLKRVFDDVVMVEPLDSLDLPHLNLMERPELGVTFTKLHCWTLIKYTKCVFLDADTLAVQNCDDLFSREEFSAAPDAGWPDCFNSGVFVFRPNMNTFKSIVKFAGDHGSFDGGDQGLLNHYFSGWATEDIKKHLPFLYNMCASATYTYLPAYKFYGNEVKIVHFIGASKPWHINFDSQGTPISSNYEKHANEHLKLWWSLFTGEVNPRLLELNVPGTGWTSMHSAPRFMPQMISGGQASAVSAGPPPADSRDAWEAGAPDFAGTAAFENIMKKIESTMSLSDDSETPERRASTQSSNGAPSISGSDPM